MIYPDSFSNTALYKYRDRYYAIHEDCWYRLWGWVPGGGREASMITDPKLIERLDMDAEEVTASK